MSNVVQLSSQPKGNMCPAPSLASVNKNDIKKTTKNTVKKSKERKSRKPRAEPKPDKNDNKMLTAKVKEGDTIRAHSYVPIAQKISVNFTQVDNAGPFRATHKNPVKVETRVNRTDEFVILKQPLTGGVQSTDVNKNNKFNIVYPSPRYGRLTAKRRQGNKLRMALEKMAIDPDSENSEISIHKQRKVIEPIIDKRSITSLINAQYESDGDISLK